MFALSLVELLAKMFSLYLMLVIIVCYVLSVWIKRKYANKYELPPAYPGALPIVGHGHLLLGDTEHLWIMVKKIAEKSLQQGGVTLVHLGLYPHYVISDPDDVYTVSNACLNKHFAYSFGERWVGDGLITGSGDIWHRHRKLLNPAFGLPLINTFIGDFNNQAKRLVNILNKHAGSERFDHLKILKNNALETICLTAFGMDNVEKHFVEKYRDALDELLCMYMNRFYKVYLQSDLIYSILGKRKKENNLIRTLNELSEKVIKTIKDRMKSAPTVIAPETIPGRSKPLIELLMELSTTGLLTDKEIREELDTTIAAATDTTATLLCYAAVLLGSYPEVQEKLCQEVIEVVGKHADVDKSCVSRLKYTEAVLKETMRLLPPVPIVMRNVDKDVKLKKITMPAGSYCALAVIGTNHHESWGPDHKEFKPERWLQADTLPENPNAFGGFSWGKRNCIGKTYAMVSMKVSLAHLVRRYHITSNIDNMKLKLDFVLKPLRGHEIFIKLRD